MEKKSIKKIENEKSIAPFVLSVIGFVTPFLGILNIISALILKEEDKYYKASYWMNFLVILGYVLVFLFYLFAFIFFSKTY